MASTSHNQDAIFEKYVNAIFCSTTQLLWIISYILRYENVLIANLSLVSKV